MLSAFSVLSTSEDLVKKVCVVQHQEGKCFITAGKTSLMTLLNSRGVWLRVLS